MFSGRLFEIRDESTSGRDSSDFFNLAKPTIKLSKKLHIQWLLIYRGKNKGFLYQLPRKHDLTGSRNHGSVDDNYDNLCEVKPMSQYLLCTKHVGTTAHLYLQISVKNIWKLTENWLIDWLRDSQNDWLISWLHGWLNGTAIHSTINQFDNIRNDAQSN